MILTKYSIVMGVFWFTVAVLVGSFVMRSFRNGKKIAVWLYVFGVLRMLLPVEFIAAKEIHSWTIYPFVRNSFRKEILTDIPLAQCLIVVWGLGTVTGIVWLLGRYLHAWTVTKHGITSSLEKKIKDIAEDAAAKVGYHGSYQIIMSTQISSPISLKILRAYIVLPKDFDKYTEEEMQYTFMHEMLHCKKNDYLKKMGLLMFRALFWWNPAAYLLSDYVEQYMELRCDKRVCEELDEAERLRYADTLLHITKNVLEKREQVLSLGLSRKTSRAFFTQRINNVVRIQPKDELNTAIVCICVLLFIVSYSFVLQPASKAPSVEGETLAEETFENAFILQTSNGYELFENNSYVKTLTKDEILEEKYQGITIYKGN